MSRAAADLEESAKAWRLWSLMGWQDVRQRYRNSALGPVWMVANLAVIVAGVGVLYSNLFHIALKDYMPYLCASILLWTFIMACLTEGCHAIVTSGSIARQIKIPLPVFVWRVIWRNIIVTAHSTIVFLAVALFYGKLRSPVALLFFPGLGLLVLNMGWMMLTVAMLSARYRDVLQVVTYGMVFVTFISPVYWTPSMLHRDSPYLVYNPFVHLLEIARAPLLDQLPSSMNWAVAIGLAIVGWAGSILYFAARRRDVIFWI
jgi:ABC-type polysaccharide/polyol phosphate export permease